MSEAKALILVMATTALVVSAVCGALMSLQVDGSLIAVAFMLIGGTGAHLLSRVVLHYAPPEERGAKARR
jgi:sugar phosphate permease